MVSTLTWDDLSKISNTLNKVKEDNTKQLYDILNKFIDGVDLKYKDKVVVSKPVYTLFKEYTQFSEEFISCDAYLDIDQVVVVRGDRKYKPKEDTRYMWMNSHLVGVVPKRDVIWRSVI